MEARRTFQELLFDKIKEIIPSHESLPNYITDVLDIGVDGAYRRIRGETPLKIDEIIKLSSAFRISLDELTQEMYAETVVFHPAGLSEAKLDFEAYLQNLLDILTQIHHRKVSQALFSVKDIPVFHLFQIPELALFKMFFWRKTIFNAPELESEIFELNVRNEKEKRCIDLCYRIAEKYSLIPTTEIWNSETVSSFIKQIGYYVDAGLFRTPNDALILCEKVEHYFTHLKRQAELGYKFMIDNPPQNRVENFNFYYNDLVLNDNTIVLKYEETYEAFIIFHNTEYLHTTNQAFSRKLAQGLENSTRKSELISKVAERARNRFFNEIFARISELKKSIR
ncbi:MAG: hypothetical protein SF052_16010 [Bacteroidia bacterium]|nr:hypothetical protein [Bacteroidia bacterium]